VLDRWDVGMAAVNEAAGEARRALVVGIQTSVGRDLQRQTLAGFTERQPEWRLSLRLCSWDDPTAGLADGTSDVAFVWLPTPDDSGLVTTVLYREPRWIALPDDHRLAERVRVPWSDLLDEPFIALPPTAGSLRDFWLATDQRPPDRPTHIVAEAANAEETFELIAAGVGVALLSAGNARIYRRPGVCCVAVPDLRPASSRSRDGATIAVAPCSTSSPLPSPPAAHLDERPQPPPRDRSGPKYGWVAVARRAAALRWPPLTGHSTGPGRQRLGDRRQRTPAWCPVYRTSRPRRGRRCAGASGLSARP
jgi:DNA-binding transcriptional LysR family regulator